MTAFRDGEIQVLLSTSVVEVGVDVPNATVMLIENAERFGLAQLHQLRGRIGRGEHPSFCVLVGEPKSLEGWRRLKIMEETGDGFRIAEEDFRIRGPGTIFGTEQSGLPPLRFADLGTDFDLLSQAREDAKRFTEKDATLAAWPGLLEKMRSGGVSAVSLVAVS
jgi:ATP-dependent DNA helicase RecG